MKRLSIVALAVLLLVPAWSLPAASPEEALKASAQAVKDGDLLTARETLDEALEKFPKSLELHFAWGQLMEEIGDIGGALDAYNHISDTANDELYQNAAHKQARDKARARLAELLIDDPKLTTLVNKYVDESLKLGDEALGDKLRDSARHAFGEALRTDPTDPRALRGLGDTTLNPDRLPESKKAKTLENTKYDAIVYKVEQLLRKRKYDEARGELSPYIYTSNPDHQKLHYLMGELMRKTGKPEQALHYWDVYLLRTDGSSNPKVESLREKIREKLPALTKTLKELHKRRKIYVGSLLRLAKSNLRRDPQKASRAIQEIFKIDAGNPKALRIRNQIAELGSTPLFEGNLRKTWQILLGDANRSVASFYPDISIKRGVLTLPPRGNTDREKVTVIGGPTQYPGYGLLKGSFRAKLENDSPRENMAFGIGVHMPKPDKTLLFLVTWENRTSRFAVRCTELTRNGQFNSQGALFVPKTVLPGPEALKDWTDLEVMRRGNEFNILINGTSCLKVRYNKAHLDGKIGLYAAGDTIEVRNYIFTSGLSRLFPANADVVSLFKKVNLSGWWQLHPETNRALPLKTSDGVRLVDEQLSVVANAGRDVHIHNEFEFPKSYVWSTEFSTRPTTPDSRTVWYFGQADHGSASYRIILQRNKEDRTLSFWDYDPGREPRKIDQTSLPHSENAMKTLKIQVADGKAVVFWQGTAVLSGKIDREADGHGSLLINGQNFLLKDMTIKKLSR